MRRCAPWALAALILAVPALVAQEGFVDAAGVWAPQPLDHPSRRVPTADQLRTGPAVGDALPPFSRVSASGAAVEFPPRDRSAVVVFLRSLERCPYSRTQARALARRAGELERAGAELLVLSPDRPEATRAFLEEEGLDLPVVPDPGGELARAAGVLNELIERDDTSFGTPFPGAFVTAPDGEVLFKEFHRHPARRVSTGTLLGVLAQAPPAVAFSGDHPAQATPGRGLVARVALADPSLALERESTVWVRLELDPELYIYTDPLPDGFIATTVQALPSEGLVYGFIEAPEAELKEFPGLGVTLPVFRGVADFKLRVRASPALAGLRVRDRPLAYPFTVRVNYQTCSATLCNLPQELEVYLELPLEDLLLPESGGWSRE